MQTNEQSFHLRVARPEAGVRLDHFLTHHLADHSRSSLLRLIKDGQVLVDGQPLKASYRVRAGEDIQVVVPPPPPSELVPEHIEFPVLYEDDEILVIVKPPGLVVHPAAGHRSGTLAHGLAHHCSILPGLAEQRPGIVHRLDKDTSGIMLVAKTETALRKLADDFKGRRIRKTYHAILLRTPAEEEGRVTAPLGRHPVHRKKMAVQTGGRYAATRWRILEPLLYGMCLAELDLETGRTHQIRVHMSHLGCPVAGDIVYGGKVPPGLPTVPRQMLHASGLTFAHPGTAREMTFHAPLWRDMEQLLNELRAARKSI